MLFQILDDKKYCVGIYCNDEIIYDNLPDTLAKTWSYAGFLENRNIEYANLYVGGKQLEDLYPPELEEDWQRISHQMKAFLKAFRTARINLKNVCLYDMIPEPFLLEWCDLKSKICTYAFENYEKPTNYDFLLDLTKLVEEIKYQKLNIHPQALREDLGAYRSRAFLKKLNKIEPYITYNIFGTKTGRLTTKSDSFPILTLDKKHRKVLKPNNDWFVELDFNAAELRTFLALSGQEQVQEDLHIWNINNVFRGLGTRQEAKIRFFAWLYNLDSKDYLLNRTYDREKLIEQYLVDGKIATKFGRIIESDTHHALSYLIQSTTSDLFLRQMIKVADILKDTKSFIAFSLHDSVTIDITNEDKHLLPQIIEIFGDTDLGRYMVNVSAGADYGNMQKIK